MIGGWVIGNAKYMIHVFLYSKLLCFCYKIKIVDMFKVHECAVLNWVFCTMNE